MKKVAYLVIAVSLFITPLNAIEKRDCSNIKKISKAYVVCKSSNLKAGIVNTGKKIKKNTTGKTKKVKKEPSNEKKVKIIKTNKIKKISKITKEKTTASTAQVKASAEILKKKFTKIFLGLGKGSKKQYPKGSK